MIETFKKWLSESKKVVFFGGAGVSTESGIPDFRSVDGLYNQKYAYPPEQILSHEFFEEHPEEFYRFYREKILITDAKPNPAHIRLAQWEQRGKLTAVITQNIDGLHRMAGSKRVYELHGTIHRNFCTKCHHQYTAEEILPMALVPRCPICGGIIKPDVVLYGESLEDGLLSASAYALMDADMVIVGGTSLSVWPAAGLIDYYQRDRLVLINKPPPRATTAPTSFFTSPSASSLPHWNKGEHHAEHIFV